MATSVTDQIKAIPINIWIDNKKMVKTVLQEAQKFAMNSSAKQ